MTPSLEKRVREKTSVQNKSIGKLQYRAGMK